MKIVILVPDLFDSRGGIQTFSRAFVKAADDLAIKNNWELVVLCLKDSSNNYLKRKYITSKSAIFKGFKGNKFLFSLAAIKESFNADRIIFTHINFSPLSLGMNLFNKNQKRFSIVHGVDVWRKLPILQKLSIPKTYKILSVSNFTKNEMIKFNNISEETFTIFPNTLDPFYSEYTNQLIDKKRLGIPDGKIILTVSRLDKNDLINGINYKGIDYVINAMPEIIKKIPDAYCVIVGDGSDKKKLEQLAEQRLVKDKIIFAGYVKDDLLPYFYKNCDLFILPSIKEGFGIVFLEAMYFSKPCIGANTGGIPDVIENNKTGILLEQNPQDIAKTVINLFNDKKAFYSIGEEGNKRFINNFSFELFKDRIEKILSM